ncbi:MAG: hypothetical protein CV087_10120, partial [Candidatus Brocadia sp. WS118]
NRHKSPWAFAPNPMDFWRKPQGVLLERFRVRFYWIATAAVSYQRSAKNVYRDTRCDGLHDWVYALGFFTTSFKLKADG